MSTDDTRNLTELRKLLLLQDNQDEPTAMEGLRLVIAFRKIRSEADRRAVIELAERLAK